MIVAGIDPGLHGAVARLASQGLALVIDTPVVQLRTKTDYDVPGMIETLQDIAHAFLEVSQSMPGQGVRSTWTTGYGYGLWVGILAARGIPYTCIRAAVWKKSVGVTHDKESSRQRAQQLFPCADLRKKKDHNRAEALLIAWYGYRTLVAHTSETPCT